MDFPEQMTIPAIRLVFETSTEVKLFDDFGVGL
jgi:hypothetical protein